MYLLEINGFSAAEITRSALVLNNISMKVKSNQIIVLTGESGAGKSILARSIIGLLPQDLNIISGKLYYCGRSIPLNRLSCLRGKKIFYAPQDSTSSLNPMIRIKNQIDETSGIGPKKIINILLDLNFSEPEKILNSYTFELSEGENQRCLLAMAIAMNPDLLILDEPTSSLDFDSQKKFLKLLYGIHNNHHMTILLITHNVSIIKNMSDYIYIMQDGLIVDHGEPSSIFEFPSHDYTKKISDFF